MTDISAELARLAEEYRDKISQFFGSNPSQNIPAKPLAAYPSADDAVTARAGGYGYGDPQSAYIEGQAGNVFGGFQPGKKGPFVPGTPTGPIMSTFDTPQVNLTGQPGVNPDLLKDRQNAWTRAHLASNYLPIAALGLEGRNTTADLSAGSGQGTTLTGAYTPETDRAWFSGKSSDPSALLHEATHRGLKMAKDRPEFPTRLRDRLRDPGGEELVVRELMQKYAGDPEQEPGAIQRKQIAALDPTRPQDIDALNNLVAQIMKERRPRGPR